MTTRMSSDASMPYSVVVIAPETLFEYAKPVIVGLTPKFGSPIAYASATSITGAAVVGLRRKFSSVSLTTRMTSTTGLTSNPGKPPASENAPVAPTCVATPVAGLTV
jgi:hypothetical protein